jgi:hypothetical protein
MSRLRERTDFLKLSEGAIEDFNVDARWIDVIETPEGGAKLKIKADDLECLSQLNEKLGIDGVELIVNEKGDGVILVDEKGVQIPFETVMGVFSRVKRS